MAEKCKKWKFPFLSPLSSGVPRYNFFVFSNCVPGVTLYWYLHKKSACVTILPLPPPPKLDTEPLISVPPTFGAPCRPEVRTLTSYFNSICSPSHSLRHAVKISRVSCAVFALGDTKNCKNANFPNIRPPFSRTPMMTFWKSFGTTSGTLAATQRKFFGNIGLR
jgi:hypothetical protein